LAAFAVREVLARHARYGRDDDAVRVEVRKALETVADSYELRLARSICETPSAYDDEEHGSQLDDDASVHRTFQRWVKRNLIGRLWALLVEDCRELGGVDWRCKALTVPWEKPGTGDQVGPNPTDRANNGTKRGVLTEADGGPVAIVMKGANVHDSLPLQDALEAVIVERPNPYTELKQHLCLDKAFDGKPSEATAQVFGYEPHIRRIGEEKLDPKSGTGGGWWSGPSDGSIAAGES
jgi:hypothetical protein